MSEENKGIYSDVVLCVEVFDCKEAPRLVCRDVLLDIYPKAVNSAAEQGFVIEQFRIKVIMFGECVCEGKHIRESEFFTLPEQTALLCEFLDTAQTEHIETDKKNVIEAMARAIKSDWTADGKKRKQSIIVCADSDAYEHGGDASEGFPKSFCELSAWWHGASGIDLGTFDPEIAEIEVRGERVHAAFKKMQSWKRCTLISTLSEEAKTIDIVLCVDATQSMKPLIASIQSTVFNNLWLLQLAYTLLDCGTVPSIRLKIIAFRDFGWDSEPIIESPFFFKESQNEKIMEFLAGIEAKGGVDMPDSAFEALYRAMQSDFHFLPYHRSLIVLYTDAPPVRLQRASSHKSYPKGMPKTVDEFRDWWDGKIELGGKEIAYPYMRLAINAPLIGAWKEISKWKRCLFTETVSGNGCKELVDNWGTGENRIIDLLFKYEWEDE